MVEAKEAPSAAEFEAEGRAFEPAATHDPQEDCCSSAGDLSCRG